MDQIFENIDNNKRIDLLVEYIQPIDSAFYISISKSDLDENERIRVTRQFSQLYLQLITLLINMKKKI